MEEGKDDRTINETSSEEEEDNRNPLGVIAEGNKGNNAEAINPIEVAVNPNPNQENSDYDDMANNAVKPGQLTAFRHLMESVEKASPTGWNAWKTLMTPIGGPQTILFR